MHFKSVHILIGGNKHENALYHQDSFLPDDYPGILYISYPDRFVIGSDEIIKPANNHPSAGSIRSTVSMLEQLPLNLKLQIGYENAYRLYKLKKGVP